MTRSVFYIGLTAVPFEQCHRYIYKLYFAKVAARYKKIQNTGYAKSTSYTQTIKNPMLVIGVNKRNKQRRVHRSYLSTEPVLPISNLSLKTISFTHFINKINIITLHMKYFGQNTEPEHTTHTSV